MDTMTPVDWTAVAEHARRIACQKRASLPSTTTVEDFAQDVAVHAWQLLQTGETADPVQAVRMATVRAWRDSLDRDRTGDYGHATSVDWQDDATVAVVDESISARTAPDQIATYTSRDLLADTLDATDCQDHGAAALLTACLGLPGDDGKAWPNGLPSAARLAPLMGKGTTRGRQTAALKASIVDAVEVGRANGRAIIEHRDGLDDRAVKGHPMARPRYWAAASQKEAAALVERPGRAGRIPDARTSGTASPLVVTTVRGERWVTYGDRSTRVTEDTARAVLAMTSAAAPYAPTGADRAADDLAYLLTPLGAVRAPASTRKSKRAGGIGGPVITRGARHAWGDRSAARP